MRECVLLLGKDLIGVQNLLKKHQALQAEIAGHEPRIKAVTQKGNAMVEEGEWVYSVPGPSQQGQGRVPFSFCYVSFASMSGVLLTIIPPGHFAAEDVKAKLSELNQKWEALEAKASQRRQDLEDSLLLCVCMVFAHTENKYKPWWMGETPQGPVLHAKISVVSGWEENQFPTERSFQVCCPVTSGQPWTQIHVCNNECTQ